MKNMSITFVCILIFCGCSEKEVAAKEPIGNEVQEAQKEAYEKATEYVEPTKPAKEY